MRKNYALETKCSSAFLLRNIILLLQKIEAGVCVNFVRYAFSMLPTPPKGGAGMSKARITLRMEERDIELLKCKFGTENTSEAVRL